MPRPLSNKKKREMRIAIALDVIIQTVLGIFEARQGTYFDACDSVKVVAEGRLPCTVCAIGAGIVSTLKMFNKADQFPTLVDSSGGDDEEMVGRMSEFFDPGNLRDAEAAFEGWGVHHGLGGRSGPSWLPTYGDGAEGNDAVRMIAVYDNVARNGEFEVSDPPRIALIHEALASADKVTAPWAKTRRVFKVLGL